MIERLKIKRVYESPSADDGLRVLVDRLWPRGISKRYAKVSIWAKEVAPSHELRKWFGHDEKKFGEFKARYYAELDGKKDLIKEILSQNPIVITLVYAARNSDINHAVCLKEYIDKHFLGN